MESPAGANASNAGAATPSPAAAAQPVNAAPQQGDRKRSRAAWAAEQHAANQAFRRLHVDDEDAGVVDIAVVDSYACVLCDGVFFDLRQEAATLFGTLLHELNDEIDFSNGYQFMYTDSRENKRKLNSAADYNQFRSDVLGREVRPRSSRLSPYPPRGKEPVCEYGDEL